MTKLQINFSTRFLNVVESNLQFWTVCLCNVSYFVKEFKWQFGENTFAMVQKINNDF